MNKSFEIVTKELPVNYEIAFAFIANPEYLPQWALSIKEANEKSALIELPDGTQATIGLTTTASIETGVIDWEMKMPDGQVRRSLSRVMKAPNDHSIYSFLFFITPEEREKMTTEPTEQVEKEFQNLARILG